MKLSRKIVSVLLVLLLALSTCAAAVTASAVDMPSSATLTIHKYAMPYSDELVSGTLRVIGSTDDLTGTQADGQKVPEQAKPLDGVVFTAYYVGDNEATVPSTPPTQGGFDLPATVNGVTTLSVNNSTEHKTGLYYIVEKSAPAGVVTYSEPFYVYLPMTDQTGSAYNTDVHAYPKNLEVLAAAKLTKTIGGTSYSAVYNTGLLLEGPQFELSDSDGTALVTVKLQSNAQPKPTVAIGAGEAKEADDSGVAYSDSPQGLADKYSALKAAVDSNGVMVVDGLPTGTYTWYERKGAVLHVFDQLSEDVTPEYVEELASFSIGTASGEGKSSTVDMTAGAEFGKMTGVYTELQELAIDNALAPVIAKYVQSRQTAIDADSESGKYYDNGSAALEMGAQVGDTTAEDFVYAIGEDFEWKISMLVPGDVASSYADIVITDPIPQGVALATGDPSSDIRLSVSDLTAQGGAAETAIDGVVANSEAADGKVKLSLDTAALGEKAVKSDALTVLNIYIKSVITNSAAVQTKLENTAYISWKSAIAAASELDETVYTQEIPSNSVWVATGGAKILKVDAADQSKKLAGAEFSLSSNGKALKFELKDGVYYLSDADAAVDKLVTDENGLISVAGLAISDYSLKETAAPKGYQLIPTASDIKVTTTSYSDSDIVTIKNTLQPPIPSTGGGGIMMFTIIGAVILALAAGVFVYSRRLKKRGV